MLKKDAYLVDKNTLCLSSIDQPVLTNKSADTVFLFFNILVKYLIIAKYCQDYHLFLIYRVSKNFVWLISLLSEQVK